MLECNFFHTQKVQLFNEVHPILTKYNLHDMVRRHVIYLYGHGSIDISDNKKIILPQKNLLKWQED